MTLIRIYWKAGKYSNAIKNILLSVFPSVIFCFILFFCKRFYLFTFRERRREGEREGEKHQCVRDHRSVASCSPPTWDLACSPGMCPTWPSSHWSLRSHIGAQSTEPNQPGLCFILHCCYRKYFLLYITADRIVSEERDAVLLSVKADFCFRFTSPCIWVSFFPSLLLFLLSVSLNLSFSLLHIHKPLDPEIGLAQIVTGVYS